MSFPFIRSRASQVGRVQRDGFDEVAVSTGYRLNGGACDELPAEVAVLDRVRPVYQRLPGSGTPPAGARTLAELPMAARAYLDRLQELAGVPIRYVSVGTRRDQIIDLGS